MYFFIYEVLLLSLRAGGEGLNLQMASHVFVLEPWWNPAVELQAIQRAHRIGMFFLHFYFFCSIILLSKKMLFFFLKQFDSTI